MQSKFCFKRKFEVLQFLIPAITLACIQRHTRAIVETAVTVQTQRSNTLRHVELNELQNTYIFLKLLAGRKYTSYNC